MTDLQVVYSNPGETPVTGKLIIAVNADDMVVDYATLGLTFDSSEEQIMTAANGLVQERFNRSFSSVAKINLFMRSS